MITGAHSIIYSTNAEADRAFFQNVLKLPSVDVGGGWLIFGLPPSELAMHPSDKNGLHELYLICSDVEAFMTEMDRRGIACDPVVEQDWGLLTYVALPGGSKLGVYEARHARPETPVRAKQPAAGGPAAKSVAKRKAKPSAKAKAGAKKTPKRAAAKTRAKSKKAGKGKKR